MMAGMTTVRRGRPVAAAAASAALLLSACGGTTTVDEGRDALPDDEARAALEESASTVDAAVAELEPLVATALGAESSGGTAAYVVCGLEPTPSGARYVSGPELGQATVPTDVGRAELEAGLEEAGWTLEDVPNESRLRAGRDGIDVVLDIGPAATSLSVSAPCVEASPEVAREFYDEMPPRELSAD